MEFISHRKIVIIMFFKKNEVSMDKLFYLGFAVLKLGKLHMY